MSGFRVGVSVGIEWAVRPGEWSTPDEDNLLVSRCASGVPRKT